MERIFLYGNGRARCTWNKGPPDRLQVYSLRFAIEGMFGVGDVAKRPTFFLGAARTGREIPTAQHQMGGIRPPAGILIAPSEIVATKVAIPL